jgi:hypothetical protein
MDNVDPCPIPEEKAAATEGLEAHPAHDLRHAYRFYHGDNGFRFGVELDNISVT